MNTITIDSSNVEKINQAIDWCDAQFGDETWWFNSRWPAKLYDFHFSGTKDAMLFSLRWSG